MACPIAETVHMIREKKTFSIGIGPKIFSVNHKGTINALRLIPIMAYVSISSNHASALYREILSDIDSQSNLHIDLLNL